MKLAADAQAFSSGIKHFPDQTSSCSESTEYFCLASRIMRSPEPEHLSRWENTAVTNKV